MSKHAGVGLSLVRLAMQPQHRDSVPSGWLGWHSLATGDWREAVLRETPIAVSPVPTCDGRQLRTSELDAIHAVVRLALGVGLHQAVDFGFEAGEAGVEVAGELQVFDDGAIEALARD